MTAARPHPLPRRVLAILWDAHAVAGTIGGALLIVVMLTGALLPFHDDLHAWSEPAARRQAAGPGLDGLFAAWTGPPDRALFVMLPEHPGALAEVWIDGPADDDRSVFVDPSTGATWPAVSHVARDLEWLHFFYHVPGGFKLVGALGLLATASLLSGVLLHLRDLWPHLGRLRAAPARARTADLHTLLGTTLVLPMLLFTTTGAIMTTTDLGAAVFGGVTFRGDAAALSKAVAFESWPEASGTPAPLPAVADVLARAEVELGRPAAWLYTVAPGDAAAVWEAGADIPGALGHAEVTWRQADGAVVHRLAPGQEPPIRAVQRWTWSLHFGDFGGRPVQVLYALLGLAGAGLIGSGLALWRARVTSGWRARLIDVTGVTASAGLAAASGVVLVVNRALPADATSRADLETGALFGAWLLTAAAPWALGPRAALRALTALAALSWGAAAALGVASGPLPFDAVAVAVAGLCGASARSLRPPEVVHARS